ncbi:transglutaminase domain-containing protein [Patiriisocius hiemis]|uniref:Transglutaminase domain-containing protein n=1 Tax=Patiriisocius hiemis TaxID=3075604 RepID=A0ABU2YDS9_9FLAO|nr:transglutaminase domain-containing protein [Constantimarinum sp. W242]MDT0556343.1 transglutaminase domain-containing protein [Constantimarinum sp. W242]
MRIVGLFFLFSFSFCFSQNYEQVDATIQLYPERVNSAEELSRFITRDFKTEDDKVRAIYSWLIKNVAYDPDEYKQFDYSFKNYRDRNQKEEKTRAKIIQRTLSKGIAVCEGYAMVFERLCQLQGMDNYLVRGDIKTSFDDIGRPFKTVHMWNIVIIDGKAHLFDATWGAGKYNGKFIKEPNYFFYKTPPHLFVKTHFPTQQEDTLLKEQITKEQFASWPIIIAPKLPLDAIENPVNGIISSENLLGEINFSIKLDSEQAISYSYGNTKTPIETTKENGMTTFTIPIELGQENLLIYFNDTPALAYKVK